MKAAPRIWCPEWLLRNLAANEIKGACVLPSRPRPASRSTGRIHISESDTTTSLAKGSRFSNRSFSVKQICVVLPGSRFSPRSAAAAASSGPAGSAGIARSTTGLRSNHVPTGCPRNCLHPRPGATQSAEKVCERASIATLRPAVPSGTARQNAIHCAELPTTCGPRRLVPCRNLTVALLPLPNLSGVAIA